MSRLTEKERNFDGTAISKESLIDEYYHCPSDYCSKILTKLADYEDKQEQGLLIELPCKVGDTFWELNNTLSEPFAYPRIAHSLSHVVYCMERLGKWCFLTEDEAEEALEKMGGKE